MPEPHRIDLLRKEGRYIEGQTLLVGELPPCEACDRPAAVVARSGPEGEQEAFCATHWRSRTKDTPAEVLIPTGPAAAIEVPASARPLGNAWLILSHRLAVLPPHRQSFLGTTHLRRELEEGSRTRIVYPRAYDPGPSAIDHVLFALKHEGLNLEVMAAFFRRVDLESFEEAICSTVRNQPLARHARRLWFLWEWMTDRRLPLPDLTRGNYVPLVDPEAFYTAPARRARRQRVDENLLGTRDFSPVVRRTPRLKTYEGKDLKGAVERIVGQYDPDTLKRAVSYLYTKETRSSFGIEGERPSVTRVERFAGLLQSVPRLPELTREKLVELQIATVDPRFANRGYRSDQVYVATTLGLARQRIEYVAPTPADVPELMDGLLKLMGRLSLSELDPVVQAAVISFGFVFIHPFSDGNGRLHRLLIHYVLSRTGFTPETLIFPVSAVMETRRSEYDACLESFSVPLMRLLDYEDDEVGSLTVRGETAPLYRYFDATRMAEDLYRWVLETIDTELQAELDFLTRYRAVRAAMAEIVDLPDREANLFVTLCRHSGGTLSSTKRHSHFHMLSDDEVRALEEVVRAQLMPTTGGTQAGPLEGEEKNPRAPKHTQRSPRGER